MVFVEQKLKFERSRDSRAEQPSKMPPKLLTCLVLKWETSMLLSDEQFLNTRLSVVADEVSKLLTSSEAREEQSSNIAKKLLAFDVFKPETFKSRSDEHPENMRINVVADEVSKLETFRTLSEEQPSNMLECRNVRGVESGNVKRGK